MDSSSPNLFVDLKTTNSYYLLGKYFYFAPRHFQNYKRQESWFKNPLPKVSIWGPRGEVSACGKRRRTWRGSGRLRIWWCSRRPSDGAGKSHLGRPPNCPFPGLSNLLRDKIFLDEGHRRPEVLLFQFWILIGLVGWRNDTGCQWWSSFGSFDGYCWRRLSLCLKRPSFYCLIHFYKRCVSSLAQMSVTTFFIQG